MTRRLFTACLGTETNSFSPIPTGLGLFGRTMLVRDGRFDDVSPAGGASWFLRHLIAYVGHPKQPANLIGRSTTRLIPVGDVHVLAVGTETKIDRPEIA